jgi:hypothetical protein
MNQVQTRTRTSSPVRWQKAAQRAIAEGIQVRQLAGSGQWIATSGSDATVAYEVEVTGNIAHGCSCLAGLNGDPCCKHRAAFYLLIGALSLEPEPEPPAPVCLDCQRRGHGCVRCWERDAVAEHARASALVAAADRLAA